MAWPVITQALKHAEWGRTERLVEPATLGDPVRPLLWVSKSLDKLASARHRQLERAVHGRAASVGSACCCQNAAILEMSRQVDRDRGEPRGPSPPTPPCVRVRTRRFG